jgi:hypothetical protein
MTDVLLELSERWVATMGGFYSARPACAALNQLMWHKSCEGNDMKLLLDSLPMLLIVVLIGCSRLSPTTDVPDTRPDDFSVEYGWREGSLPPPYHYEYTIIIKPDGQGEVTMIPDYPSETAPKWTETFTVKEEELDSLYQVMVANGLFTQKWRTLDPSPVGGSRQSMTVTAGGKQVALEAHLVSDQEASAEAMYSAVEALVPKEIWDKLNARREQYMQENPRK